MKNNIVDARNRYDMFYWQVDRPFNGQETKEIFLDRYEKFDINEAKSALIYGLEKSGLPSSETKIISIKPPGKTFSSVNVIYEAVLSGGKSIIIRIHPPQAANGYFWVESVATKKAKEFGVPTYNTYYVDDTRKKFPFDFMIIERMPGLTMQLLEAITPELERHLVEETGEYLAKIHQVKTYGYGFFNNQIAKEKGKLQGLHPKWKDHLFAAFARNLDYLTDNQVIENEDRIKIEKIFTSHDDFLLNINPSLIHNDLADWNELVDGNHVSAILDWDECFSGDPIMDFAAWSVFFPYSRMEFLKKGYCRVLPQPNGFEDKLHLYRLRYIVSKSVSRHMKFEFSHDEQYHKMLDYAIQILQEEFDWYGL